MNRKRDFRTPETSPAAPTSMPCVSWWRWAFDQDFGTRGHSSTTVDFGWFAVAATPSAAGRSAPALCLHTLLRTE